MQGKLAVLQCLVKLCSKIVLPHEFIVQLLLEVAKATSTIQLGPILGHIGITDQFPRRQPIFWKECHTDTG